MMELLSFKVYTTYDDMLTDEEYFPSTQRSKKGRDSDRSAL